MPSYKSPIKSENSPSKVVDGELYILRGYWYYKKDDIEKLEKLQGRYDLMNCPKVEKVDEYLKILELKSKVEKEAISSRTFI
ncbi:hypothetical protein LIS04_207 [Listeria phage LIS04]|nr:hypothetical protein LIS04_207 [Listeria phage LIS04]